MRHVESMSWCQLWVRQRADQTGPLIRVTWSICMGQSQWIITRHLTNHVSLLSTVPHQTDNRDQIGHVSKIIKKTYHVSMAIDSPRQHDTSAPFPYPKRIAMSSVMLQLTNARMTTRPTKMSPRRLMPRPHLGGVFCLVWMQFTVFFTPIGHRRLLLLSMLATSSDYPSSIYLKIKQLFIRLKK